MRTKPMIVLLGACVFAAVLILPSARAANCCSWQNEEGGNQCSGATTFCPPAPPCGNYQQLQVINEFTSGVAEGSFTEVEQRACVGVWDCEKNDQNECVGGKHLH